MGDLKRYLSIVDDLRESRRRPLQDPEQERPILDALYDMYLELDEHEQDEVERQSWRAWPNLFDARQALGPWIDTGLDAAEVGPVGILPRAREGEE